MFLELSHKDKYIFVRNIRVREEHELETMKA